MKKMPVKIKDKELPSGKFKVYYDYRKRTSGGFVDAIILSSLMMTIVMWFLMYIFVGR